MTQQSSASPALEIVPSKGSSEKDFDYFHGRWKVHNRKLRSRLTGCDEWSEYESEFECRPILRGFGNVGTFTANLESGPFEAFTLRLFNPETRLWSLCWAYSNAPILDIPQIGTFDGDIGTFLARNFWEETPVIVKFNWDKSDVDRPVWSQAFSTDEGKTWEWNWYMHFRRQ